MMTPDDDRTFNFFMDARRKLENSSKSLVVYLSFNIILIFGGIEIINKKKLSFIQCLRNFTFIRVVKNVS